MPCKQQSHIPTVYQTHVFAKLHKHIKDWLHLKILLNSKWNEKDWTAILALSKSLVLLVIFLLANSGDAFMNELSRWKSCSGKSLDSICGTNEQIDEQTNWRTTQMNRASKHPYIKTRKVQFIGKAGCRASKQDYCFGYSIYFRHLLYIWGSPWRESRSR